MKLANKVYIVALFMFLCVFAVPAQYSEDDTRNTAPTVGTGGPMGGPTGLFTVYDGKTLRKGEYTLSIAYSNYDRDPGNVDITSVPLSFQIGLTNRLELFFTTEGWRGIKVNSPANLSSFYLPNSQLNIGGFLRSPGAIVLAPRGPGANPYVNSAVFRPIGAPFAQFPYSGASAGNYGAAFSGPFFGFPANTNATLGSPVKGGAADLFPGVGSVFGGILPGIVLTTQMVGQVQAPVVFSRAPSYLEDAPFINRRYGTTAFNSANAGFKWRMNDPSKAIGYGVVAYYSWYLDNANNFAGFNQMQRGAGPGANKGDIGVHAFADARLTSWANLSANLGYVWTGKSESNGFVLLDRADQVQASIGADFPINKYFQPILEIRALEYIGGHTPNALEQDPLDGIAGFRIFPRRWFGFGFAYRHNFNQQDTDSFSNDATTGSVYFNCVPGSPCVPVRTTSTTGVPSGFVPSSDPHGYIAQFWIGRRDKRAGPIENKPPSVDSVTISDTMIMLPCPPGTRSESNSCNDNRTVDVATRASDPENDVLTYNYTVSGGRIVGQGANVQWDLSNAQPGTYTITTGVDDGCGVCGKTETKTIEVKACPDCKPVCECVSIGVSGPSGITNPGDSMTFTANVGGGGDYTYNWTVSNGTITSGQGTSSITVATTKGMAGQNVTASVSVGGLCPECPREASETAGVAPPIPVTQIDEFGKAPDDDVKARVDGLYTQLNNNPTAQGYIINYGTAAEIAKRRAQIMKAINRPGTGYDASRVTFIDGPNTGTGINTKFYIVPAGADVPQP
ncbi:MAG: hypothetical protein ACKVQW_17080 [Pyrinomonadaceae bacterium]